MGRKAPLFRVRCACSVLMAALAVQSESAGALQAGARAWTTIPDHRIDEPGGAEAGFGGSPCPPSR